MPSIPSNLQSENVDDRSVSSTNHGQEMLTFPRMENRVDLEQVDGILQADDCETQDAMISALHQNLTAPQQEQDEYEQMPLLPIPLSQYRSQFENGGVRYARRLLEKKCVVTIDNQYKIPADSEDIFWDCPNHYLDFFLVVSNRLGLHAVVPSRQVDHTFFIELDLAKPIVQFRGKHAKLNYDPAGRMLWIGKCRSEDVYVPIPRVLKNPW
jgi:hypothetical protein